MPAINFTIKDLDETPLTFGKYKGDTPDEIAKKNPVYICWLYETIEPKKCSKLLYLSCDQIRIETMAYGHLGDDYGDDDGYRDLDYKGDF